MLEHTLLAIIVLHPLLYLLLRYLSPASRPPLPSELTYVAADGQQSPLPQTLKPKDAVADPTSEKDLVDLSVIVPAYNEEKRLPIMLSEALRHLETMKNVQGDALTWEILVVDDGSKDRTAAVAQELAQKIVSSSGELRVIVLEKNIGKGGTVAHGMLHSRGRQCLFADADGATRFSDLDLLQAELSKLEKNYNNHGVAVGSRAHLVNTEAVVQRSFVRNLLMRGFHLYLSVLGLSEIRDTQCGFKLFSRSSVCVLFPLLHSQRWIFDCELLILARMANIPIIEVNVHWTEIDGSKVNLVWDSIGMAKDLLLIRANYLTRCWQRPSKQLMFSRKTNNVSL